MNSASAPSKLYSSNTIFIHSLSLYSSLLCFTFMCLLIYYLQMMSVSSLSFLMPIPSFGRPQRPPVVTLPPSTTPLPSSPSPSFLITSLLLLNQFNQVVLITTGVNSCSYIYDSEEGGAESATGKVPAACSKILLRLEEFLTKDRLLGKGPDKAVASSVSSLLSGSLSLALCYIQRIFRSGTRHPQPRILCLQGSPDGPEQYVAVMNAIFTAQRSMIPIDSCVMGVQHSAFLQQASYITGGVYLKPQHLDGLFQYLSSVFATDLQSRSFLQLPRPAGVDFRASCFCHKKTIDMGYVCSVCLSIFCKRHKKCSTCGSDFSPSHIDLNAPH